MAPTHRTALIKGSLLPQGAYCMDSTPAIPIPINLPKSLDPYGQLIRMLMPRAENIDIFGAGGVRWWSSSSIESPDLLPLVTAACQSQPDSEEGLLKRLDDGTPVYLFWLHD